MSTRAQVYINDNKVYLYQHCDGYDLINTVKKAIGKKCRWNDPDYLTRIIFSEMIKDDIDGETGYGIGTQKAGDIEYLITVNCQKETITNSHINYETNTIKFSEC
jgi:hypothetical protein